MPTPKMPDDVLLQALAAIEKHGSITKAADKLGINRNTLQSRIRKARDAGFKVNGKYEADMQAAKPATKPARTLQDFRAQYDKEYIVPRKIKAALQALAPGGWEYEAEFAKLAGVGLPDLSTFRDAFNEYVVVLNRENRGRRIWAGSKDLAAKMRQMVG